MDFFSISPDFTTMLVRFFISLAVTWFIVARLYYTKSRRRDFFFTFILSSIAIFMLVFFMIFVLEDLKTKTSIGIGIGLFGIFSIMRYRTDTMPVREMTYLFVIISLAVVNAIAANVSILELLITNVMVILAIWICEKAHPIRPSKLIQYDRLALVKPEKREELIADLKARTGLEITKVEVGAMGFLKDMAMLKIYYIPTADDGDNQINHTTKISRQEWRDIK